MDNGWAARMEKAIKQVDPDACVISDGQEISVQFNPCRMRLLDIRSHVKNCPSYEGPFGITKSEGNYARDTYVYRPKDPVKMSQSLLMIGFVAMFIFALLLGRFAGQLLPF